MEGRYVLVWTLGKHSRRWWRLALDRRSALEHRAKPVLKLRGLLLRLSLVSVSCRCSRLTIRVLAAWVRARLDECLTACAEATSRCPHKRRAVRVATGKVDGRASFEEFCDACEMSVGGRSRERRLPGCSLDIGRHTLAQQVIYHLDPAMHCCSHERVLPVGIECIKRVGSGSGRRYDFIGHWEDGCGREVQECGAGSAPTVG